MQDSRRPSPDAQHQRLSQVRQGWQGKPLGTAPGKSSDAGKPYKKFGGDKQLAYMAAVFESIQKGLKKQKKSKKHKKRKKRYDSSSSDSDSE